MSKYITLDDDIEEDGFTLNNGRKTIRKTFGKYFKQKLKDRFINKQIEIVKNMSLDCILADKVGSRLYEKFAEISEDGQFVLDDIKCYQLSNDLLSKRNIDLDDHRIYELMKISCVNYRHNWPEAIKEARIHDKIYNCSYLMSNLREVLQDLRKEYLRIMNYGHIKEKFDKELDKKTGLIKQFLNEIYDEVI